MVITLDARQMESREQAHRYLREQLQFPEHYGGNLDALYDCLTELGQTEIRFVNLSAGDESYFARVLPVFQEAQGQNRNLKIEYDLE